MSDLYIHHYQICEVPWCSAVCCQCQVGLYSRSIRIVRKSWIHKGIYIVFTIQTFYYCRHTVSVVYSAQLRDQWPSSTSQRILIPPMLLRSHGASSHFKNLRHHNSQQFPHTKSYYVAFSFSPHGLFAVGLVCWYRWVTDVQKHLYCVNENQSFLLLFFNICIIVNRS